jgi:hypothetical protein
MNVLSLFRRFNPIEEGYETTGGLVLKKRPSLSDLPEVKFAVFSDSRFFGPRYLEFEHFLPEGFLVVGPPNGQNCFEHCLNANGNHKTFDRWDILQEFEKHKYATVSENVPRLNDIICYYVFDPDLDGYSHSGVCVGVESVSSRWGRHSPLIVHPINEVLPAYMGELGGFNVWRKAG